MNIILCGFMGSGKTTVGKIVAEKLDFTFIDMDQYIEGRGGMPVSRIFDECGESGFRELEHNACVELSKRDNCVLATGGGAVTFSRNVAPLRENGLLLYLYVTPELVLKRLKNDVTRPLLASQDKEAKVRSLMKARHPLYLKAADFEVDASGSPINVADRIIGLYYKSLPPG